MLVGGLDDYCLDGRMIDVLAGWRALTKTEMGEKEKRPRGKDERKETGEIEEEGGRS